jgi:hypothetical protein
VRLDLEQGSLRVAAAVVACRRLAAELVPEVAPLVARGASARLSLSLLAGAALPSAARTADGQLAWHANGDSFLMARRRPSPPSTRRGSSGTSRRASRSTSPSATSGEEAAELSLDGLPVVGQLGRRPLAVACGFSGLAPGFAFAAARWLADALLRGNDPTPDALRPTRAPLALPTFEPPGPSQ